MLNMVKGCTVPFPEKLSEGYEVQENRIFANVNAEKILDIFNHFVVMHADDQGFFILELPANKDEEEEIRPGVIETTHKHVYYIDALSTDEALTILIRSGELLINDGISYFGYGFPKTGDEMMLDKYNVITIYSPEIDRYSDFFDPHEIPQVDDLLMAWDTFSEDHPGVAERIDINGKSVFDLVDQYKDWGIYKAETREDS